MKKFENKICLNYGMTKTTKTFNFLKILVLVVFDVVVSNIISIFFKNIVDDS